MTIPHWAKQPHALALTLLLSNDFHEHGEAYWHKPSWELFNELIVLEYFDAATYSL